MTIHLIQPHEDSPPLLKEGDAYLYVTNLSNINSSAARSETRLTLCVDNYADTFKAITDWLCNLSFSQESITLVVYSDCDAVSATDVAHMASIILPKTPIEVKFSPSCFKSSIMSLINGCDGYGASGVAHV